MGRPWTQYESIVIESYYAVKSGKKSRVHARPLPGQGYSTEMDVECSRKMRKEHPIGTRFRVRAKVTDKEGGKPFLYTHWSWPYEIVSEETWLKETAKTQSEDPEVKQEGIPRPIPNVSKKESPSATAPITSTGVSTGSTNTSHPVSTRATRSPITNPEPKPKTTEPAPQPKSGKRICFPADAQVLTPSGSDSGFEEDTRLFDGDQIMPEREFHGAPYKKEADAWYGVTLVEKFTTGLGVLIALIALIGLVSGMAWVSVLLWELILMELSR